MTKQEQAPHVTLLRAIPTGELVGKGRNIHERFELNKAVPDSVSPQEILPENQEYLFDQNGQRWLRITVGKPDSEATSREITVFQTFVQKVRRTLPIFPQPSDAAVSSS